MTDAGAIEVRDLRPGELAAAVGVLGRGMRDNPIHVVAYGDDPERRLRCHTRLMGALFRLVPAQQPLCAVLTDGTLVGVTGATPPGACQPTPAQRVRLLPTVIALGPRTASRVGRWMSAWADHDPEVAHVHLGPVAVDSHLQGRGIGSLMMQAHCDRLDVNEQIGYLETDKEENVSFYQRFGYEVVAEDPVLGIPNWFMRREAQETQGA